MPIALLAALVAGGLIVGFGVVIVLAIRPRREFLGALVVLAGFYIAAWALAALAAVYPHPATSLVGTALAFAAFLGGYSLASVALPRLARDERRHSIPPTYGNAVGLLVLSDAEPERYSARATALELVSLEDDGILRLGIIATPFLFAAQKSRYRAVGGTSPARSQVRAVADALTPTALDLGFVQCRVAWCSGSGSLAEAVDDLVRAGCGRFVVVPLCVAESVDMLRARDRLEQTLPEHDRVHLTYSPPLRPAQPVEALLADKISRLTQDSDVPGVVLVARGQPEAHASFNAAFDDEETIFLNQVKMLLSESVLPLDRIRTAWADWREPDVAQAVRHLAALGASRILVCPVCHPVENVSTLLDLPMGIAHARLGPGATSAEVLETWGTAPFVIESLGANAAEALAGLAPAQPRDPVEPS